MSKEVLITFASTHDALAAQHTLSNAKLPYRVLPTPVEISSNCGIALSVSCGTAKASLDMKCEARTLVEYIGPRITILGPYVDG